MLKDYYALAKPGLVYGNLITVIAGFLLGAHVWPGYVDLGKFVATVFGIALVMAAGCVFNNIIDADIDGSMGRTKERSLVTGRISKHSALVFGVCLGVIGFGMLAIWTNLLTVGIAAIGLFAYIFLYTIWSKRKTVWSTAVGSIAGATPPVVGYCAASGHFDLAAVLLFAILVLWQISHFYSIGIYRHTDYVAAGLPILPVKKGIARTKIDMVVLIALFLLVAPLLTVFGYLGSVYSIISILLGLVWLGFSIAGFQNKSAAADKQWARLMFFTSLIVMMGIFLTIALTAI